MISKKYLLSYFIIPLYFLLMVTSSTLASEHVYSLYINRVSRQLYVIDAEKKIMQTFPVNIGRGGLAEKKSMSDYVTPTGEFEVDLILYSDANFNAITPNNVQKFQKHQNFHLIKDQKGLQRLFQNMNVLDFDGDGKPDQAYGKAYLGLKNDNIITGPKLHTYHGTPYWFSIALHGTPDEKLIGSSVSGGCVHLSEQALDWLVTRKIVTLGTKVMIHDGEPK